MEGLETLNDMATAAVGLINVNALFQQKRLMPNRYEALILPEFSVDVFAEEVLFPEEEAVEDAEETREFVHEEEDEENDTSWAKRDDNEEFEETAGTLAEKTESGPKPEITKDILQSGVLSVEKRLTYSPAPKFGVTVGGEPQSILDPQAPSLVSLSEIKLAMPKRPTTDMSALGSQSKTVDLSQTVLEKNRAKLRAGELTEIRKIANGTAKTSSLKVERLKDILTEIGGSTGTKATKNSLAKNILRILEYDY